MSPPLLKDESPSSLTRASRFVEDDSPSSPICTSRFIEDDSPSLTASLARTPPKLLEFLHQMDEFERRRSSSSSSSSSSGGSCTSISRSPISPISLFARDVYATRASVDASRDRDRDRPVDEKDPSQKKHKLTGRLRTLGVGKASG